MSVYVAGPQSADGGQLHIALYMPGELCKVIDLIFYYRFHGGKTVGSVKLTFVEAEWANFKKFILSIYGNFIKKCFSE